MRIIPNMLNSNRAPGVLAIAAQQAPEGENVAARRACGSLRSNFLAGQFTRLEAREIQRSDGGAMHLEKVK